MPVKRKVKRFVIDVNSFITIFINQETEWLQHYILQNKLEIFVDENLISELRRVLDYPRIKKRLILNKNIYINFVLLVSTFIVSEEFDIQSPDAEDDYLFALALTVHAKLLVKAENALLNWKDAPVEVINLPSFKKLF